MHDGVEYGLEHVESVEDLYYPAIKSHLLLKELFLQNYIALEKKILSAEL